MVYVIIHVKDFYSRVVIGRKAFEGLKKGGFLLAVFIEHQDPSSVYLFGLDSQFSTHWIKTTWPLGGLVESFSV